MKFILRYILELSRFEKHCKSPLEVSEIFHPRQVSHEGWFFEVSARTMKKAGVRNGVLLYIATKT